MKGILKFVHSNVTMAVFYLTRSMNMICRPQSRLQSLESTFQRTHLAAECDTSSKFKVDLPTINPALPTEGEVLSSVGGGVIGLCGGRA